MPRSTSIGFSLAAALALNEHFDVTRPPPDPSPGGTARWRNTWNMKNQLPRKWCSC